MNSFIFNPLDFGFEPFSNFPELIAAGAGNYGNAQSFVKITAIADPKQAGRKVFWYCICNLYRALPEDQRVEFFSHSYDEKMGQKNFSELYWPRSIYSGLISSAEFAEQLLCHLFGALTNDSVNKDGKERFRENLNQKLRDMWKKENV